MLIRKVIQHGTSYNKEHIGIFVVKKIVFISTQCLIVKSVLSFL